jgi:hypothetical protein
MSPPPTLDLSVMHVLKFAWLCIVLERRMVTRREVGRGRDEKGFVVGGGVIEAKET